LRDAAMEAGGVSGSRSRKGCDRGCFLEMFCENAGFLRRGPGPLERRPAMSMQCRCNAEAVARQCRGGVKAA